MLKQKQKNQKYFKGNQIKHFNKHVQRKVKGKVEESDIDPVS